MPNLERHILDGERRSVAAPDLDRQAVDDKRRVAAMLGERTVTALDTDHYDRLRRGSKMSRRPSPKRFSASTMIAIIDPGTTASQALAEK